MRSRSRTSRSTRQQQQPPHSTRRRSRRLARQAPEPAIVEHHQQDVHIDHQAERESAQEESINPAINVVSSRRVQLTLAFILNPELVDADCAVPGGVSSSARIHPNDTFDEDYAFGFPDNVEQNENGEAAGENLAAENQRSDGSADVIESGVARRTGRTNKWIGGYKYTRIRKTSKKIYYRCSHYRSMECDGKCHFDFRLESYCNFVPHSCGTCAVPDQGNLIVPSVNQNVMEAMKREVDTLAVTTTANRIVIWDIVRSKFYGNPNTNIAISGLSREEVLRRVNRARAEEFGGSVFGQIEVSPWSQVQLDDGTPSAANFFLFHYSYYDRVSKTRQRILGWAHPVLFNLLKHKKTDVFVDGTFRSVPPKFKQCVIFSTYDRPTKAYYPAAFVLCSSKKYDAYFHVMRLVLDETDYALDPEFVYCDFEAGFIRAIKDHFPNTSVVGCLFHFKQACRRKMKGYGIPDRECSIAMSNGVLDMLTVIKQEMVKKQGIPWVKAKIESDCVRVGRAYSAEKWKKFWRYFARTWLVRFPPTLWNVETYSKATISRTNNPLERFNREMNAAFEAHPNLPDFVVGIEKIARRYANLKADIEVGRAKTPKRLPIPLPKPVMLPDPIDSSGDSSAGEPEEGSSDDDQSNVLRPDLRANVIHRRQGEAVVSVEDFARFNERTDYYDDNDAIVADRS